MSKQPNPAGLPSRAEDPRATDWGLYRARYERDSCGFGLIASLDDEPSHWVVQTAISSLNRLTHRGAVATDGKTGDGCGLLIKMPRRFLRAVAQESQIKLAPQFAAGLVFLDPDPAKADAARRVLAAQIERENLSVAGFRSLRVDPRACGEEALRTLPHIEQLFVNAGFDIDEATFNRRLYMARRRTEKILEASDPAFYIPSLSASTIVYKGMVMPQHLAEFYPDLQDPRLEASVVVFHQRFSTNTLPQWRLAHPYRYLAHNGEINTVQGNRSGRWRAGRCFARRFCRTWATCCPWSRSPAPILNRSTTCSSSSSWAASIPCTPCGCSCRRRGNPWT